MFAVSLPVPGFRKLGVPLHWPSHLIQVVITDGQPPNAPCKSRVQLDRALIKRHSLPVAFFPDSFSCLLYAFSYSGMVLVAPLKRPLCTSGTDLELSPKS